MQRVLSLTSQSSDRGEGSVVMTRAAWDGYGGSAKEVGRAFGRSGDNGVDDAIDIEKGAIAYIVGNHYATSNGVTSI
jgi:restriction endonuclease Mrr